MNVGEFKKLLEDRKTPDDHVLCIRVMGTIGAAMQVKSAGPGIDWDRNSIVIQPETALTIHEWYRDLKKISRTDAAILTRVLKEAKAVVEDDDGVVNITDEAIDRLRVALERLDRFQKQGF